MKSDVLLLLFITFLVNPGLSSQPCHKQYKSCSDCLETCNCKTGQCYSTALGYPGRYLLCIQSCPDKCPIGMKCDCATGRCDQHCTEEDTNIRSCGNKAKEKGNAKTDNDLLPPNPMFGRDPVSGSENPLLKDTNEVGSKTSRSGVHHVSVKVVIGGLVGAVFFVLLIGGALYRARRQVCRRDGDGRDREIRMGMRTTIETSLTSASGSNGNLYTTSPV